MKASELIFWHAVADVMPDSEITVLLFDPNGSEPIWLGYKDKDGWFYIDGHRATPTHWADMPHGPK